MTIMTILISTWNLTSDDEGSRVGTRTYLNVKNLFFVGEKKFQYYCRARFCFLHYFIDQASEPSSCVRVSLMVAIYIQLVACKTLVKSNFKLCLC